MAERIFAIVKGRVQGVNFRWYTRQTAERLGLAGYARNMPDGSVQVLAEGERPALEELIAFLREGSPSSYVDSVDVEWRAASGDLTDFLIRS
jgi:acylphosphatase